MMHSNCSDAAAYIGEICSLPTLSADEEHSLAVRAAQGDREARTALIEGNLRLVVAVVRRYIGCGLPLPDLIQEGNLGLMRAVEKFDHTLGNRLSTYAIWWIRQTVTRAIAEKGRAVRLPVHVAELACKRNAVERALTQMLGREPAVGECAAALGADKSELTLLDAYARPPLSLDAPVCEDDVALGELVCDERATDPLEEHIAEEERAAVLSALAKLSPREERVLRLRYGIDDGAPMTLEDIGRRFNVTRERVRQIEGKAMRKLRVLLHAR